MSVFEFSKRGGAPAGAIYITAGQDTFLIDDGSNPIIGTDDPTTAAELTLQPYLMLSGGSLEVIPPPLIEQVILVNGILSKPGPDGTTIPLGSQVPVTYIGGAGGVLDDTAVINNILSGGNVFLILLGTCNISSSLIMHSNSTICLGGATIHCISTTNPVDNIIRNATLTGGDTNLSVIGVGAALIDGNCGGVTAGENTTTLWKNVAMLFVGCTGVYLRDFTLQDYNGWGVSPQNTTKFRMTDIHSVINNVSYNQGLVNTADGGTDHHYENLTGVSHDDFLALVSRPGAGFSYSRAGGTLSRVVIRNIRGNNNQVGRMLRLLTGDGSQIFHVDADGIIWEGAGVPADMVILDGTHYVAAQPAATDFFDISIRNVKGGSQITSGQGALINIASTCKQVKIDGVTTTNAWNDVVWVNPACVVTDLYVSNVQVANAPNASGDGTFLKNEGIVTTLVVHGSSGSGAMKSILNNTGSITGLVMRNMVHPACTAAAILALGTQSNGPDYDMNLGNVAFRRRSNLNGRTVKVVSSSGDNTLNSATWVGLASTTGFDVALTCYVGAWVEIGMILQTGSAATQLFVDAATYVSSALTNFISDSGAFSTGSTHVGFLSQPDAAGTTKNLSGSVIYQIVAGDLTPLQTGDQFGTVTFRPVYRQSSALNQTLKRSTPPVIVWGKVLD